MVLLILAFRMNLNYSLIQTYLNNLQAKGIWITLGCTVLPAFGCIKHLHCGIPVCILTQGISLITLTVELHVLVLGRPAKSNCKK